ncbi:MAG TPA: hypothetical protein VN444_04895 [Verrucomicrobiae bacterium]|nr:hypothetical protein [Verrucomicrobiae bacterium]
MANPWVSVQKLAVVPTFNTQFDTGPVPSDWDSLVMQRVVYDPDPMTGADRSLRSYLGAISYGLATLDAKLFPRAFSDGPGVIEAAWQSLPEGHGYPYVLCVIPRDDGGKHRGGFFTTVNKNDVNAVARVAMFSGAAVLQQRQIMGVWAMEVLHAIARLPDLYAKETNPYPDPPIDDYDNMCFNAGTHSCAYLKRAAGWLPGGAMVSHKGTGQNYSLHAIGMSPPPPGRVSAVSIRSRTSNQSFIVEARLKVDLYEKGFAPLTTGKLEFRGLKEEGVIVYEVTTPARLEQVKLIRSGLQVGQSYSNSAEGFTIRVTAAINGGMSIRITRTPDPRCADISEEIAEINKDLAEPGLDVDTRKGLLKQRGKLKDEAKRLGCP